MNNDITAATQLKNNVSELLNHRQNGYKSFAELARAMGISAPSLSHALKNPQLSTIERMANVLHVSIATLFAEKKSIEGFIKVGDEILHIKDKQGIEDALNKANNSGIIMAL